MDYTDFISSLSRDIKTSVTTTDQAIVAKAKRNKSSQQVKSSPKSVNTAPNNAADDTELPEFDLRTAVLFSAILSPKFKEEDIY